MNKVTADKTLAHEAGMGLAKGKAVVDDLLAGNPRDLEFESIQEAEEILRKLEAFGIDCEISEK